MIINRKTSVHALRNKASVQDKANEATVYLYSEIGGYWGIDHQEWIKVLNDMAADTIHLRIDSPGGDVFAARAMKTAIQQHKAKVIAHIDGLAASAASFLAMGADEIEIVDGGFLMIHNASSFMDILGYFNIDGLKSLNDTIGKEIDLHGKINDAIANDYAKRSGKPVEDVLSWMAVETWFTAKMAMDNGLADRIYDGKPVEGNYDLSIFNNVPEPLRSRNQTSNKRTIEKALRDAGCSANMAKSILSGLFKEGDLRDAALDVTVQDSAVDVQRDAGTTAQRDAVKPEPKKPSSAMKYDELIELAKPHAAHHYSKGAKHENFAAV